MPTTTTREQERWAHIIRDPALQDVPYKVETNEQGQIILSPHSNRHSFLQDKIQQLLRQHAPEGSTPPEFAIATPHGVKSPDVAWISPERRQKMETTGDPTTLAPEICVEVLSESNTAEEMTEKRTLYREAGAEEVWLVETDGRIRFFGEEEMDASQLVPEMPDRV
jgi:Uma2 family endonuclease